MKQKLFLLSTLLLALSHLSCKSNSSKPEPEQAIEPKTTPSVLNQIHDEAKNFQKLAGDFVAENPKTKEMTPSQKDLLILSEQVKEAPKELIEYTLLSPDADEAIKAQEEQIEEVKKETKDDTRVSTTTAALPAILLIAGVIGSVRTAGIFYLPDDTFLKNTVIDAAEDPILKFLGNKFGGNKIVSIPALFAKFAFSPAILIAGIVFLAKKSSVDKKEQAETYNKSLAAVGIAAGSVATILGGSQLIQMGLDASKKAKYKKLRSDRIFTGTKEVLWTNPGRAIAGVLGVGLGASMIFLSAKTIADTQKAKKKRMEAIANGSADALKLSDDTELSSEAKYMYYLHEMGDSLARLKSLQATYCSGFKEGDRVEIPCYN